MKMILVIFLLIFLRIGLAQYSPPAGEPGSTAIHMDSSIIVGWASQVISFDPGPQNISVPGSPDVDFGIAANATGHAEGNSIDVVTLGDGGSITLGFFYPIKNGSGPDFAVFENGFDDTFLEFAHVEVSTDGLTFVRIPSVSLISSLVQTTSFGSSDTELVHNLAGKFRQGYGTPFDLEDVVDSLGINLDSINFVRVVDVVGCVQSAYASFDADGDIVNDPFPTEFETGGFDLDAVGTIHVNGVYSSGISENEMGFNVYPNPTSGKIYFRYETGDFLIKLLTVTGREVHCSGSSEFDFTDKGLETGIYFVRTEFATGEIRTERVVYAK